MEIQIKWPWEMVWTEYIDQFIARIKEVLPPGHELQNHELYPGIKWDKRNLFIVDDETTGKYLFMNFERMKPWKKTKYRVPTIKVIDTDEAAAELIERDHLAECAKYNPDGSRK